ncbi:hypothetical protein M758_5G194500 [Ceratodon purpureus]|uniref:Uncharacterized protein n=1 Tax=Ceratodon purpureus TaxID=3225 RepID=A0A8T0I4Z8_CERPU|nr:hypothetical protein KC19_5G201800 [Ceratodon purpureus]KAG0617507.1 hypothetical protein M758_5G194500 [Ceratodon purpureus]
MLQSSKSSRKKPWRDPRRSQISDNGHLHHLEPDNQKHSYSHTNNSVEKTNYKVPSHIINEIPAFYRKQTLITEPTESNYLGTKGQRKSQSPVPWYGRSFTDVSNYMHKPPPPHLPQDVPLIDYKKNLGQINEEWYISPKQRVTQLRSCESKFKHWWHDEPTRPPQITVPPQYMRKEDLYAALPRQPQLSA